MIREQRNPVSALNRVSGGWQIYNSNCLLYTQLALSEERLSVQPLPGLEISTGELRRLIGFKPDDVIRPSIMGDRHQRSRFFGNEIALTLVLTAIIVGVIYAFIILPTIGQSIPLFIILLIVVAIAVLSVRWLRRRLTYSRLLTTLLEQVDKYHAIIESLDNIYFKRS